MVRDFQKISNPEGASEQTVGRLTGLLVGLKCLISGPGSHCCFLSCGHLLSCSSLLYAIMAAGPVIVPVPARN